MSGSLDREEGSSPGLVELSGPGPFQLPVCGPRIEITRHGAVIVLWVETFAEEQRIAVPIPAAALPELGRAVIEALTERFTTEDAEPA